MLSGLIANIKVYYVNKLLPNQVYAGLFEIIKDSHYYHHSTVSKDYSHLTEEGKDAVIKWLNIMACEMLEFERVELDARAKKVMWEELKK